MTTLALKYRPRLLSDLVGQEGSVKALANALKRAKESGKIHQAYLFAGVRGTGKTSTARILARALNCAEGPTATPCGVCDPCRAAEQPDSSLDIVEIDAASRASVADARALREQVQTRPAFCRYRVYIIDEVHMLSTEAFNALLKVIEEPPPHAIFVLATTELQDVPDTIKSRVQIFPFRLIPVGLIEGRLKHVCEQEGVTFEGESLRLVAEAGQGSMRDALTILDRVISAGDGKVQEEAVREQLGIVSAHLVQGVMSALAIGDSAALVESCRELAEQGADWATFWRELVLAFRDRLEQEARSGRGPQDLLRWARMLNLLLSRERDLRDSSLPRVVVELALVTAAQLPHLAPLDALVSGTATAGASPRPLGPPPASPAGPPPVPPKAPQVAPAPEGPRRPAPAPAPAPAFRPSPAGGPPPSSQWRQACAEAMGRVPGFRALGTAPQLATDLHWEPPVLRLAFPGNVRQTLQDLERERANPHLLAALGAVFPGLKELDVRFEEDGAPQTERPEDRLRREPAFQELLRLSGGEVLEIRREG
ncbi:MAG: DNA polymerase III subunit gamma/tau [Geothrix sp.]|uniref:DNA polymerase III subunit gamma/tau n=1 Tax=Geothrix sp. TaxID=1962974 RepID=UPI0017A1C3E8|nr:DNA polymerase III subunit gamma/tau [Geothrix sp.]NWJ39503.1 DNA polymerase III subunit gamma/tau [Geothrix sp.]WIL19273.1 MAG: DNA polymerase III subunit gamma/tau [Geothrix sp.]